MYIATKVLKALIAPLDVVNFVVAIEIVQRQQFSLVRNEQLTFVIEDAER